MKLSSNFGCYSWSHSGIATTVTVGRNAPMGVPDFQRDGRKRENAHYGDKHLTQKYSLKLPT